MLTVLSLLDLLVDTPGGGVTSEDERHRLREVINIEFIQTYSLVLVDLRNLVAFFAEW